MCALRPMEERSEAAWMAALATERARAAPHAEIAGSGECGSHRCARTVDLQLMHLPQRARRLSFSLSASFFWDAPPVDFGAGVSIASSTQRLRHVLRSRESLGSLVKHASGPDFPNMAERSHSDNHKQSDDLSCRYTPRSF